MQNNQQVVFAGLMQIAGR